MRRRRRPIWAVNFMFGISCISCSPILRHNPGIIDFMFSAQFCETSSIHEIPVRHNPGIIGLHKMQNMKYKKFENMKFEILNYVF